MSTLSTSGSGRPAMEAGVVPGLALIAATWVAAALTRAVRMASRAAAWSPRAVYRTSG